jgi:hypothetical protein
MLNEFLFASRFHPLTHSHTLHSDDSARITTLIASRAPSYTLLGPPLRLGVVLASSSEKNRFTTALSKWLRLADEALSSCTTYEEGGGSNSKMPSKLNRTFPQPPWLSGSFLPLEMPMRKEFSLLSYHFGSSVRSLGIWKAACHPISMEHRWHSTHLPLVRSTCRASLFFKAPLTTQELFPMLAGHCWQWHLESKKDSDVLHSQSRTKGSHSGEPEDIED